VISTQIVYYEQAKETPQGPETRPIVVSVDPYLLQIAQNYDSSGWRSLLEAEGTQQGKSNLPKVHFGPFAVGDKVVADQSYVDELMRLHPKLVGIEMESYGVAEAAARSLSRPRFLAVRGISDFADEQKDDSHRMSASSAAAAFAVDFLRHGPLSVDILRTPPAGAPPKEKDSLIAVRHLSMQQIPPQTIIESLPPQFVGRSVTEILVDQTDLYENGRLTDPIEAVERQGGLDAHVDRLLESEPGSAVGYFGIAHIPLLFHSGYCLTNKRKLQFFELNRYTGRWEWLLRESPYPELVMNGLPTRLNDEDGDVLVRISISSTVRPEETANIVPCPIASLHLRIEPPHRDVLKSQLQLYDYGSHFRYALDTIHELVPNRERTHVFYAGPVSLAVFLGQLIIQTIDRRIVVYNYTAQDSPRYSWGLEITAGTHSPQFLVRVNE
jgi:hypothetical protein